jgi:hypothetical protein
MHANCFYHFSPLVHIDHQVFEKFWHACLWPQHCILCTRGGVDSTECVNTSFINAVKGWVYTMVFYS